MHDDFSGIGYCLFSIQLRQSDLLIRASMSGKTFSMYGNDTGHVISPLFDTTAKSWLTPPETVARISSIRADNVGDWGQVMPDKSRSGMYVGGKEIDPQQAIHASRLVRVGNEYMLEMPNSIMFRGGTEGGYVENKNGTPFLLPLTTIKPLTADEEFLKTLSSKESREGSGEMLTTEVMQSGGFVETLKGVRDSFTGNE